MGFYKDKKYNTAVGRRGQSEQKDITSKIFANDWLTAFQYDVCFGYSERFDKADCIYSHLAWQDGYEKFTKDTITEWSSFDDYIFGIKTIINFSKKPAFIITGKKMAKMLNPDLTIDIKFNYHNNGDAKLCVWNTTLTEKVADEVELMDYVCKNYDTILDFCCGYGTLAYKVQQYNKKCILSDVNSDCVEYLAKTFIQGGNYNV